MMGRSGLPRVAAMLVVVALSACQSAAPTPPTSAPVPATAPAQPTAATGAVASPAVAASPAPKPAASPAASAQASPAASPAASPVASVVAAVSVSPALAAAPPPGKRGGTLILARQGEATNLDPQKVPAFTSQRVFELIYSRLTSLTGDLTVQPDLAESWTVSGDGKTYTFKLRQAKWHNGDPVTSGDVKFTFDRILTVDGSVAKSLFTDIDHVDTPDPQTVVFVLKQPNVTILPYMASPNASIVSEKVAGANANDLSKKEAAIGSGPFKLAEWVPDNYMLLQANKDYYLPGLPYLDAIRINIVPDQAGLVAALRTKAADMALIEDAQTAQSLRQENGITLDARPSPNYNLLFINTARKPFDNVKVRQAISYAIDRQQIIDTVALGEGEATGPIAPALTQYAIPVSQYPSYTRDVAKAKQLLQEANVGPIEFTMLTETTEPTYAKDIAQIVQQQLADVGIKMNIELLEFAQWVQRWLKADFDMAPGLNGGNADPDYYIFRYFTTDGNLNFVTSYQNQTVSDAIKQARTTTDVARRKQLYQTAQTQLVDDAPFIWTYVPRDYVAFLNTTKDFVHIPT
ncbi:MAG TPA: ABC transporter substrate-binding protein, partial [Chloroflexota bacterium]|nr:ABC transporter substrate-binding protein [Chloroflexota bacterium]